MNRKLGLASIRTLPDTDHVLRFVQYSFCEKDDSGEPIGFYPQAFMLKTQSDGTLEEYLSAGWVEFYDGDDHHGRVTAAITGFGDRDRPKVGAKARFALANVGRVRSACKSHSQSVRISHEPVPDFESHASIRQFSNASSELLDLLASDVWAAMHQPIKKAASK